MPTIQELDARLQVGDLMENSELDEWIRDSDETHHREFFGANEMSAVEAARRLSQVLVERYLNSPEFELRLKTKCCIILNNLAIHKPMRPSVFAAMGHMTNIFEEAIQKEGLMPFDSELGRMSEHVLVLLMRVTQYKLKAGAVQEFVDKRTQFAVQLLLAILLKQPPYEIELRCNCIAGMLGFTQPQTYFAEQSGVDEIACTEFTKEVDYILDLMLRLQSLQVINDTLGTPLLENPTVAPVVHVAMCNAMRCIMNIFQFCSSNALQWRQHILQSTNFVDGAVMLYLQNQTSALETYLAAGSSRIPMDILGGIHLALRFCTFSTYKLGHHARSLRFLATFANDMLLLSLAPVVSDANISGQMMSIYCTLFHFLSNMDAFAGEEGLLSAGEEPLQELTSELMFQSVEYFLQREVAPCGTAFVQAWYQKYMTVDAAAPVSQSSTTFMTILNMFSQILGTNVPVVAPKSKTGKIGTSEKTKKRHKSKNETKQMLSVASAANPVEDVGAEKVVESKMIAVDPRLICALSGNVMKTPVVSPYGHTYDEQAILRWLHVNGSVCPMSGKELREDMLKPDKSVSHHIMQQMVKESMNSVNQEDAMDLYEF